MNPAYELKDTSSIFTPALLFYKDLIRRNIARAVEIAGSPSRLRPHAKTHKTGEIIRLEGDAGITKHKCATLAEAEMIASCGLADVLLAYPSVGPNCHRLAKLAGAYHYTRFGALADSLVAVQQLSAAMVAMGAEIDVLLDVDVGMHRTGIPPAERCVRLYQQIAQF